MKKQHLRKIGSLVLMASLTLILCSNKSCEKSIVEDIAIQTVNQDGDFYLDLAVDLKTGAMFPSITIPVANPNDTSQIYGQLTTVGGFDGVNEVGIAVNLSQILALAAGEATLPDGSPLPVYELQEAAVIDIPLGKQRQHHIYLAAESGVAAVGFALTFKELDAVGNTILGTDVIIPFDIKVGEDKELHGAAGFFTSTTSGQTGVCVFIDVGEVIYPSELVELKYLAEGKSLKGRSEYVSDQSILNFEYRTTTKSRRNKLYRKLYKMSKKGQMLSIN